MSRTAAQWFERPQLSPDDYVDNRIYTDPTIFAEEQEHIFRKVWLFAAHESELPEPYSYRTMVRAGIPIFLLRGKDLIIRAFVNVCPHRGAMLLTQHRGKAPTVRCLFHQWTFDHKGHCLVMTRPAGYQQSGLQADLCGLRELRAEVQYGLVFINFDDTAVSLREYIGSALDAVAPVLTGNRLDLIHFNRSGITANWKHYQETNLDLYHEQMHFASRRTSMASADYHKRRWRLYGNAHGMLEPLTVDYTRYGSWTGRGEGVLDGLQPNQFLVLSLFPNFTLIARSTVLRIDTTVPLGSHRTDVEWRGLGDSRDSEEVRAARARHYHQFWGPFGRNLPEDLYAIATVEQSLRNGASPFSLMARHEDLLANDDVMMRRFYKEWGRLLRRSAAKCFHHGEHGGH